MTYNEIISKIKNKIRYYSSDVFDTDEYVAMKFYENYNGITVKTMFNIQIKDLFTLILIKNGMYSDENMKALSLLDDTSNNMLVDFFNNLNGMGYEEYKEFFIKFLNDYVKEFDAKLEGTPEEIGNNFVDIIFFIINNPESFEAVKGLLQCNCVDKIIELDKQRRDEEAKNFFGSAPRELKRFMKSVGVYIDTKDIYQHEEFVKAYKAVKKMVDYSFNKSNGLTSKKIKSNLERYSNALNALEQSISKEDMTSCIGEVSKIDDKELVKEIYLFMGEHNKPYYERLEKEFDEKNTNMEYMYINYFKSKGMDFNSLSSDFKRKIMEDSIDTIKEKIAIISNFSEKNKYFYIIASTSLETLQYLLSCVKKNIIDYEFIRRNIGIVVDTELFDKFKTNLLFLLDCVNVKKFEDKSFLLSDFDIIRSNIALLEKYGIPYKNCSCFTFIKEPIKDKISLFVEVGLESEIYNNPDILNSDIDLAKRVLLTQMVGDDIYEDGKISKLLVNKSDFFVKASKVDSMLERDNSKYNSGCTFYIPNDEVTKLSYIVDGVIVPKTRIKEQPVSLEEIIKPSLYSKEDIKRLEKRTSR